MFFYFLGGKVTQSSSEGITIIDSSGMRLTLQDVSECLNLPAAMELLWLHSQESRNQCLLLERTLAQLKGPCNFPIIVGRRPITAPPTGKENQANSVMVIKFFIIFFQKTALLFRKMYFFVEFSLSTIILLHQMQYFPTITYFLVMSLYPPTHHFFAIFKNVVSQRQKRGSSRSEPHHHK